MNFGRFSREQVATGVVIALLAGGAVALYAINRRADLKRVKGPDWLDVQQPPDGVATDFQTLSADQSWAANRCRPMTACCSGRSAGSRIRKTYPGSLASSDHSFIRASFAVGGGC